MQYKQNTTQVLERAIRVAIERGYLGANDRRYKTALEFNGLHEHDAYEQLNECYVADTNRGSLILGSIEQIIFSHVFAKALWGEDKRQILDCGHNVGTDIGATFEHECPDWGGSGFSSTHIMWEYHLQQMVIADDPIAYLAAHLLDGAAA